MWRLILTAALMLPLGAASQTTTSTDPLTIPIAEDFAARNWLAPVTPMRVFANTYSVGFEGLSVVLIETNQGLILIDGALPQSVGTLQDNIRALGFQPTDIKYILSTEPHFDHAGGLAALSRDTGATIVASRPAAQVLLNGQSGKDDPQFSDVPPFPKVERVRIVRDGQTLQLGNVAVRAIATPGHTAGSMSWTWRSCEANVCKQVVFGSSLNPVSADDYHFGDRLNRRATAKFRQTFSVVRALPCDILITAHPKQSGGDSKLQGLLRSQIPNPFIDPTACQAYANRHEQLLNERIIRELRNGH